MHICPRSACSPGMPDTSIELIMDDASEAAMPDDGAVLPCP